MASDLIYREDAKDFVRHAYHKGLNPVEYLDEVPTADVVEVVRCKNCKHRPEIVDPRRPYGNGLEGPRIDQFGYDDTCPYLCGDSWYNRMPNDDGFCDLGEAKDG